MKTLKDIQPINKQYEEVEEYLLGLEDCKEILRQAAIEWVKYLEDKISACEQIHKTKTPGDTTVVYFEENHETNKKISKFIKHFFNLSEEDLNETKKD